MTPDERFLKLMRITPDAMDLIQPAAKPKTCRHCIADLTAENERLWDRLATLEKHRSLLIVGYIVVVILLMGLVK
jgi:hypothetical protein